MITDRQKLILDLIISFYAQDKLPVGSKALLDSIDASSATIRNDMKVLEELGLIQKEHTSSGRVPSIDGYKYFVENFLQSDLLNQSSIFQVMKSFDGEFYRLSDLFERAAAILSDLTGLTSFVLNIPQNEQILSNFDLTLLDSHSVLAVMTLGTGEVRTNQFILPKSMAEIDLVTFRRIVEERLVGKKILDLHYALRTEIPQIVAKYFSSTREVLELFENVFADLFTEHLTSSGREHIFDYRTANRPELYKLFDNDDRMIHEIREMTKSDDLRAIRFDNNEFLGYLTLIAQRFIIPYRGIGTLAVVGPIELDYQKVLTTLDLVARVLTLKLTDYYRYIDGNHYEIR